MCVESFFLLRTLSNAFLMSQFFRLPLSLKNVIGTGVELM